MSASFTEMLMKEYGCTEEEAKQTIANWYNRKSAKDLWVEEQLRKAEMEEDDD